MFYRTKWLFFRLGAYKVEIILLYKFAIWNCDPKYQSNEFIQIHDYFKL